MNQSPDIYNNTINYLYDLQKHGIKLGLSNTFALMELLDEPQKAFRSVHIAGTNGKGSTATTLASILTESGYRVGLFTSPHLVSFTERMSINGTRITESEVIELADFIRGLIAETDLNPTFFEFVTAMAFHFFASKKVDWAIIETGMGGRLDATNVLQPDLTIITNIGMDHSEFLGSTLAEITNEKAGIIKQDVPLITSSLVPEVVSQLTETAQSRNADIHVFNQEFSGEISETGPADITINYRGESVMNALKIPLTGKYQLFNACMAIRAAELLQQKGVSITDDSIRQGLSSIILEGRLEIVSDDPFIIIDSAHNPDAAVSLADSFREIYPDKEVILITGIMDDKELFGILSPLVEIAQSVILTKSSYERAASPERLEEITRTIKGSGSGSRNMPVYSTGSIAKSLETATSLYSNNNIILITGSFYTTGEVKEILGTTATLSRLREHK